MYNQWVCTICDFVYKEKDGMPSDGIPPGTPFEKIPDNWMCPDCGVTKVDFKLQFCET